MIPHRTLSNDFSDSGLKDRVMACRKRLRENRVMFRVQASTAEQLFPQARMNCSPFEPGKLEETRALLQLEEQEVGNT